MSNAILLTLLFPACSSSTAASEPSALPDDLPAWSGSRCLAPIWPEQSFEQPVWFGLAPGDPGGRYVVERAGRILRFDESGRRTFADLVSRVYSQAGEQGLLGLAFHPDYAANRRLFVYYTTKELGVLSEFAAVEGAEGPILDKKTQRVLLTVEQPWRNHNGGSLNFGPDGRLYLALGDGGSAGDPNNAGQDTNTLLGKILRIDVDEVPGPGAAESAAAPAYGIPDDNPFAPGGERPGAGRPEIYAWGLRNPWRMSFDPKTGRLWAGDVGQIEWEEIDIIERGGNYGWRVREARSCYEAFTCDREGLIEPVAWYGRGLGQSVTGGAVVRDGSDLDGAYVYGDFVTGRLWALVQGGPVELAHTEYNFSSFGYDADGGLVAVHYGGSLLKLGACAGGGG